MDWSTLASNQSVTKNSYETLTVSGIENGTTIQFQYRTSSSSNSFSGSYSTSGATNRTPSCFVYPKINSISYTGSPTIDPGNDICYSASVTAGTNSITSIQAILKDNNNSNNEQIGGNERSVSVSAGATQTVNWCGASNTDDPMRSYEWYIAKIKDSAGNETGYSNIVQEGSTTVNSSNPIFSRETSVVTLSDNTAPTFGGSLSMSNIGPRSAEVTWSPASDNIGVSNYQVFINGSSVGTTVGTNYTLTTSQLYEHNIQCRGKSF